MNIKRIMIMAAGCTMLAASLPAMADGDVQLADCEHVHRAILAAFDRNIEDYSLTVGSVGIDAEEADEMLKTINE